MSFTGVKWKEWWDLFFVCPKYIFLKMVFFAFIHQFFKANCDRSSYVKKQKKKSYTTVAFVISWKLNEYDCYVRIKIPKNFCREVLELCLQYKAFSNIDLLKYKVSNWLRKTKALTVKIYFQDVQFPWQLWSVGNKIKLVFTCQHYTKLCSTKISVPHWITKNLVSSIKYVPHSPPPPPHPPSPLPHSFPIQKFHTSFYMNYNCLVQWKGI